MFGFVFVIHHDFSSKKSSHRSVLMHRIGTSGQHLSVGYSYLVRNQKDINFNLMKSLLAKILVVLFLIFEVSCGGDIPDCPSKLCWPVDGDLLKCMSMALKTPLWISASTALPYLCPIPRQRLLQILIALIPVAAPIQVLGNCATTVQYLPSSRSQVLMNLI